MKIKIEYDDGNYDYCDSIEDAISTLEAKLDPSYTFYHIGGYELLRDGTKCNGSASTIEQAKAILDDWEIEYPTKKYFSLDEFIEDIEPLWEERWNDGGGSGWIDYD